MYFFNGRGPQKENELTDSVCYDLVFNYAIIIKKKYNKYIFAYLFRFST